jgi:hypothetical protein
LLDVFDNLLMSHILLLIISAAKIRNIFEKGKCLGNKTTKLDMDFSCRKFVFASCRRVAIMR